MEQSSKILQRALNDGYDYIRDYTIGTEANGYVSLHFVEMYVNDFRDDSEGKRVKRICTFYDERYGKNRSITDIDWSPKVWTLFMYDNSCSLFDAVPGVERSVV